MQLFEVELPGVWIDPVALDATSTSRIRLGSRTPEPGEEDVPLAAEIDLTLYDTLAGSSGISVSSCRIYVQGVLAYDGSTDTFQAGYNGPNSVRQSSSPRLRIVLDPTAPFLSEEAVTVRVVAAPVGALTEVFDETYSFTCVDATTPTVAGAVALGHRTVRVIFSEDVQELDASSSHDALNPANYSLAPLLAPAVAPEVLAATPESATAVILTLADDLSQGVPYRVTVGSVWDLHDNAVTAPFNFADFSGFACLVPAERSFSLYEMLPEMNRREDFAGTRDLEKFLYCLQDLVDLLLCDIDRFADILDPDTAPENDVLGMLDDLGCPFAFAVELPLIEKRKLVKTLVALYKQKGTDVGIQNAVRLFLGFEVTLLSVIDEGFVLGDAELGSDGTDGTWELGAGGSFNLYAFRVAVDFFLDDTQRERLIAIAKYMKPAHTHFLGITEPTPPAPGLDHLELGLSELGLTWELH